MRWHGEVGLEIELLTRARQVVALAGVDGVLDLLLGDLLEGHALRYEPPAPAACPYSVRSARIGSIWLARVAGIRPASAETMLRSTTVPTAIIGSCPLMP